MRAPRSRAVRIAFQGIAWTAASGTAVGLLLGFGSGATALRELFVYAAVSTTYAGAIGLPATTVLPHVTRRLASRGLAVNAVAVSATLLAVCVVGSMAAGLVLLAAGFTPPARYWAQFAGGLRIALVVAVILTAGAYFSDSLRARAEEARRLARASEYERRRAARLADQARLTALAARIHPHFLFNTLNTIAALIPEQPRRAEQVVARFAALLRAALDRGGDALVPLVEERSLVEDYLDIQRARFGDKLRAVIDVPDELERSQVPPFCLQTLVENAVVHAASTRSEPTVIAVSARRDGGALLLAVEDDGPGFSSGEVPEGRGIATLRERLETIFGGAAKLEIRPRAEGVRIVVSIPEVAPEAVS